MPEEWERFRIRRGDRNAVELGTVRHIAHVPHARRIVEDERIKAGLVYDESRLNTSRISVAWASTNSWAWGSITAQSNSNSRGPISLPDIPTFTGWSRCRTTGRPPTGCF